MSTPRKLPLALIEGLAVVVLLFGLYIYVVDHSAPAPERDPSRFHRWNTAVAVQWADDSESVLCLPVRANSAKEARAEAMRFVRDHFDASEIKHLEVTEYWEQKIP